MVGGALALATGAGIRCFANQPHPSSFGWMEGGTAVISVSTPLLLGCITQVAANWFPQDERALATSIGVLMSQAGMTLSFILPPMLVTIPSTCSGTAGSGSDSTAGGADTSDEGELRHQLVKFGTVQFAICAVAAAFALCFFRTRPPVTRTIIPGATVSTESASTKASINPTGHEEAGLWESVKLCYGDPHFWVLSLVFGIICPIYWTLCATAPHSLLPSCLAQTVPSAVHGMPMQCRCIHPSLH